MNRVTSGAMYALKTLLFIRHKDHRILAELNDLIWVLLCTWYNTKVIDIAIPLRRAYKLAIIYALRILLLNNPCIELVYFIWYIK